MTTEKSIQYHKKKIRNLIEFIKLSEIEIKEHQEILEELNELEQLKRGYGRTYGYPRRK